MNNQDHIEKMLEDALNSADGANRAVPRPFLYTRLKARMDRGKEGYWERTARFVTRPAVAFAGLFLVVLINTAVIAYNQPAASSYSVSDQLPAADEFSTSVATLDFTENTEP